MSGSLPSSIASWIFGVKKEETESEKCSTHALTIPARNNSAASELLNGGMAGAGPAIVGLGTGIGVDVALGFKGW